MGSAPSTNGPPPVCLDTPEVANVVLHWVEVFSSPCSSQPRRWYSDRSFSLPQSAQTSRTTAPLPPRSLCRRGSHLRLRHYGSCTSTARLLASPRQLARSHRRRPMTSCCGSSTTFVHLPCSCLRMARLAKLAESRHLSVSGEQRGLRMTLSLLHIL